MKKNYVLLIFLFTIAIIGYAQTPTLGLRHYDQDVTDGYTLFTPEKNTDTYLINNCGEVVNKWTFNELPGLTSYILENGNILRPGKTNIEIRDWDNNLVWSFSFADLGINQHHDIEPLPNGNILCLMRESHTPAEMIALGRDPSAIGSEFKLDTIIEIEPVGTNQANIVWEWKFIDHFIQDFDATKANFGSVIDHPELIDLNYVDSNVPNQTTDYTHVNGMDYNADLDQIIMSTRHLNEIHIIDHSTTTAEAAGHTGGNSNRGGDILWRWGNPAVYKQGDLSDQKLFLQHDSKWVESGYLDEGKITVFNNLDATGTFSSIHLVTPEIIGGEYTKENSKFKPIDSEWSWNGDILGNTMFEGKKSGAHALPNGNFMVCENTLGQVSEISRATGNVLWTYRNPTGSTTTIYDQFETNLEGNNILFRAEKYPTNYIGFTGKDLTTTGILEDVNSESANCRTLSVETFQFTDITFINPVKNDVIVFNQYLELDKVSIVDINGKTVFEQQHISGNTLNIQLTSSIYFMRIQKGNSVDYRKIIIQ